jgi:hypothetical protein
MSRFLGTDVMLSSISTHRHESAKREIAIALLDRCKKF